MELAAIQRLLVDLQHSIDSDKVAALIADAKTRLETSVGLHPYTSYLREHLGEAARFDVICALWQLALADDRIDKFEEHTIRQAADLLYLSHSRFYRGQTEGKVDVERRLGRVGLFAYRLCTVFLLQRCHQVFEGLCVLLVHGHELFVRGNDARPRTLHGEVCSRRQFNPVRQSRQ